MNKKSLIIFGIIVLLFISISFVLAPPPKSTYSYDYIDVLKYPSDDCTGVPLVVCSNLLSGGSCQLNPSECYRIEAEVMCSAAGNCPNPVDNVYHTPITNLYDSIDTVNDIFWTSNVTNSTPPPAYTCTDDCVGGTYSDGKVSWTDAPTLTLNKDEARQVYNVKTKNDCSNAINTQFYACSSVGCTSSAQSTITFNCNGVSGAYVEIDLNSTTTETNVDYWQYSINGGTNITFTPNSSIFHESAGSFNITVYVHDLAGNINSTVQYYTVDKIPAITVATPTNTTYTSTAIDLNVSADETVDTWWYTLNSGTNTTFTPNTTITGIEGSNDITIWANDTAGYENYTIVYFTVDSIPPQITIQSPTNITYSESASLDLNVSADETVDTWMFELNGNGTNVTFTSNTTITPIEGQNNITIWANDTVGNMNSTTVYFYVANTSFTVNYTSGDYLDYDITGPTGTFAATGQNSTTPAITINNTGNTNISINMSVNVTQESCFEFWVSEDNTLDTGSDYNVTNAVNTTVITEINTTTPKYLWSWMVLDSCTAGTTFWYTDYYDSFAS